MRNPGKMKVRGTALVPTFGGLVLSCIEADCLPSKREQSFSTCPRKIYALSHRLRSKSYVYELLHRSKSHVLQKISVRQKRGQYVLNVAKCYEL